MAKNVFRPGEIKPVEDTVFLKLSLQAVFVNQS